MKLQVFFFTLILVAISLFVILTNSARRPLDEIKAELWSITPKGSSIKQVQLSLSKSLGKEGRLGYSDLEMKVRSISLAYGRFYKLSEFPFATTVNAYWGFDAEEKLVEITLDYTLEAP